MSNNILVSISCITYNHGPYIRQCLEGFIMQKTSFNFEVLIHDDASTDGTTEIIKEYENNYPDIIKPLYEKENQWIKGRRGSKLFNYPRAKGKYIAICEGDDYWIDPLKLQKQVDLLEKNKDCSLCSSGYFIQEQNKPRKIICNKKGNDAFFYFDLSDWSRNWLTKTLTVVFRKDFLLGYEGIDYKYYRDIHLFYSLLKKGTGIYVSEALGVYRVHPYGVCSMVAKNVNAIHSYNCYKEIYQYNRDKISKYLYFNSICLRLIYRTKKHNFIDRISLWKEGNKLVDTLGERIKLSLLFLSPSFILKLHYKDI